MISEEDQDEPEQREKTLAVFRMHKKFGLGFRQKQCFDCFFYADAEDDANNLAIELHKRGYQVSVYSPEDSERRWSVIGVTPEIAADPDSVATWSGEMQKLAKAHRAEFDGWGSEASQEGGAAFLP